MPMETPELVKLNKEFQSRGVEMIGLSTEDPDASAQSVQDFVREYKVDYQIGWATREVALTLMQGRTNDSAELHHRARRAHHEAVYRFQSADAHRHS